MRSKQVFFSVLVGTIILLSLALYLSPRELEFPERTTVVSERLIPDPDFVPSETKPQILTDPNIEDNVTYVDSPLSTEIVRKTDEDVTVVVRNLSYEVRGEDFAVVDHIDFEVINHANRSIDIVALLYVWDEEDPFEERALVRTRIPLSTYYGSLPPNRSFSRNAGIYIPVNDIDMEKTLRMTIAEAIVATPKAFVSAELRFNITE